MNSTFPERLRTARKRKKISGEKLTELLGSGSKQTVSNWENGNSFPETPTLIKIAEILCVTLDWLLTGKEEQMTYTVPDGKMLIKAEDYIEYVNLKNKALQEENESLKRSSGSIQKP